MVIRQRATGSRSTAVDRAIQACRQYTKQEGDGAPKRGPASGHGWIQDLLRGLGSKYRQRWVGEQTDLFKHGRLVPVDPLVGKLAVAKTHNHDKRNVDMPMGRRNSGEHPGHLFGM